MTSDEILRAIRHELRKTREAKLAVQFADNQVEQECADQAFSQACENLFNTVNEMFDRFD